MKILRNLIDRVRAGVAPKPDELFEMRLRKMNGRRTIAVQTSPFRTSRLQQAA